MNTTTTTYERSLAYRHCGDTTRTHGPHTTHYHYQGSRLVRVEHCEGTAPVGTKTWNAVCAVVELIAAETAADAERILGERLMDAGFEVFDDPSLFKHLGTFESETS